MTRPGVRVDARRRLDVAALTDHATMSDNPLGEPLRGVLPPEYAQLGGLTPEGWARTGRLADAADEPGAFTALRGFEWSEPLLGHVNVWFSQAYTDVLQAGTMAPFFEWLQREPDLLGLVDGGVRRARRVQPPRPRARPVRGVPVRRPPAPAARQHGDLQPARRLPVRGPRRRPGSPLCACLNAGWRTGLSGVTDEHGVDWGFPEGKGRTGLWLREHSRAGVKEAMASRRFFATRTSGLRLDAVAEWPDGTTTRMGGAIPVAGGTVRFSLDLARDDDWLGLPLTVQVLRPGPDVPEVVEVVPFTVGDVVTFEVPARRRPTATGWCCGSATRASRTRRPDRPGTRATTSRSPTPAPGGSAPRSPRRQRTQRTFPARRRCLPCAQAEATSSASTIR